MQDYDSEVGVKKELESMSLRDQTRIQRMHPDVVMIDGYIL